MAWQLAAIWIVVGTSLIWFVRDERRRRDAALDAKARFYAQAPAYRHVVRFPAARVEPKRLAAPAALRTDSARFDRFLAELRRRS